jgi:hypothetical protein
MKKFDNILSKYLCCNILHSVDHCASKLDIWNNMGLLNFSLLSDLTDVFKSSHYIINNWNICENDMIPGDV